jgi:cyanophycinase
MAAFGKATPAFAAGLATVFVEQSDVLPVTGKSAFSPAELAISSTGVHYVVDSNGVDSILRIEQSNGLNITEIATENDIIAAINAVNGTDVVNSYSTLAMATSPSGDLVLVGFTNIADGDSMVLISGSMPTSIQVIHTSVDGSGSDLNGSTGLAIIGDIAYVARENDNGPADDLVTLNYTEPGPRVTVTTLVTQEQLSQILTGNGSANDVALNSLTADGTRIIGIASEESTSTDAILSISPDGTVFVLATRAAILGDLSVQDHPSLDVGYGGVAVDQAGDVWLANRFGSGAFDESVLQVSNMQGSRVDAEGYPLASLLADLAVTSVRIANDGLAYDVTTDRVVFSDSDNSTLVSLSASSDLGDPVDRATGNLFILGGNMALANEEVWLGILQSSGGGPIGVIPAASSAPNSSGNLIVETFDEFAPGSAFRIDISQSNPGNAESPAIADLIRSAATIYFTGGDQSRAADVLLRNDGSDTLALAAIRDVLAAGGVIAGSSAGAALMSDPMITGGNSPEALLNGIGNDGVSLGQGFGFFPYGMTDQHFLTRGRLGRLVIATNSTSHVFGYGVEDDSAFIVDTVAQQGAAIGSMGVVIVDVSNTMNGIGGSKTGTILHYMETGDTWSFANNTMTVADNKSLITTEQFPSGTISSSDIWDDFEVWRVMTQLVDTADQDEATGSDLNFRLRFLQTSETRGFRGAPHTYGNSRTAYAVQDVQLNILPNTLPSLSDSFILYGNN